MKTYQITEESKERAKQVFKAALTREYPWTTDNAFAAALDALLVDYTPNQCDSTRIARIIKNNNIMTPSEAQAWADGLIAKPKPSPIAPGSKFRMPNGDEVQVINWDKEVTVFGVVNITNNYLMGVGGEWWHRKISKLQAALEAAGAVPVGN